MRFLRFIFCYFILPLRVLPPWVVPLGFGLLVFGSLGARPLSAETRVPQSIAEVQLSFAPLVRQAAPAVVNIYARRVVAERQNPFGTDPFFRNLFKDFGQLRPRVQNSLGSGVILSGDGIVVSNYHVVGQATDIRVVLQDRREFAAHVLLADEESDLALLQLQGAADMPHLSLRSSDTVEVGELVLAIGNPFGVGQTVSSGIVSGLARSGAATGNARGYFIQTDAPINPGNSGGALIDTRGRLIGVNTSILSRSGGSNGIGFAIPASLVAQFLKQAADGNRSFTRPWAGAGGQAADADVSESLGLSAIGGVVITALHPTSPLKVAGIKVGDVVTAVAGQLVYTPAEMLYRMSVAGIGNTVQMRVVQGGVTRRYALGLIAPPEKPARAARTLGDQDILSGVSVLQINPAVIVELGLPLNSAGVVVTDVGPLGPRIGLQRMDVLVSVNSRPVETTKDVARLLRRAGRRIELVARRGARQILLRFRL